MQRIKELTGDVRIIIFIIVMTFMASIGVGFKIQEYQIEKAHARAKQERLEAYMQYQQLIEKYMNMAENIEPNRDL